MNENVLGAANEVEDGATKETQVEDTQPKTYTQEEVDALLQQEGDRRVSAALKKAEKRNQEKVREAEKLAKMNEAEKYEYQLQQRELAIQEKEKQIALAENKAEASKILAEKGLSVSLVDFIIAEDAETMNNNIQLLEKAFKMSVRAEVERRLSSNTPKKNLMPEDSLTVADFNKMSAAKQQELYNTDPALYRKLTGQN